MKALLLYFSLLTLAAALVGCGEPKTRDLSKVESQPPADLQRGREAKTIDEWARANPNNGAPGSGESEESK